MASESPTDSPYHRSAVAEAAARERLLQVLLESPDISQTFPEFARAVRDLVPADRVSIIMLESGVHYRIILVDGESPEGFTQGSQRKLAETLIEQVVTQQTPFLYTERQDHAQYPDLDSMHRQGYRSFLLLPLIVRAESLGVLTLGHRQAEVYTCSDAQLLVSIVQHLSLAVAHYRLIDDARRMKKRQEDILAFVAHELRTPLHSILGFCEVLLEGPLALQPLAEDQRDCITIIRQRARDQLQLINALLEASRSASGQIALSPERLDLAELLPHLTQAMRPQLEEKNLTMLTRVSPDVPPVLADRDQLHRILENLLSNAIKYTLTGGTVSISAAPGNEGFVQISVSDTGIGIAPEHLQRIFVPFQHLHKEIPGTGLGLAITRNLVEQHGGRIWVESKPGSGSTFHFTLPRAGQ